MKMKEFNVGAKLRIAGFAESGRPYRQKLLAMGLRKGAEFELVRKAPLGDPMEIKIGTFNLSLRKDEADALEIEGVKP
ncbi:MAG: FeoA family protein [Victivallales bacterium]